MRSGGGSAEHSADDGSGRSLADGAADPNWCKRVLRRYLGERAGAVPVANVGAIRHDVEVPEAGFGMPESLRPHGGGRDVHRQD